MGLDEMGQHQPAIYSTVQQMIILVCAQTTSLMRKTVWWTKSHFLDLIWECGKDQWDCNTVNYYVAHTSLTSCDARRRKIVFSFWLDKGTLRCGNNFWSTFLCSIVLFVKAFQCQETQFSPNRNMKQEQRSLTICWTAWHDGMNRLAMGTILSMVLQPFTSFAEHGLHSPSTTMGSHRQSKNGKQTLWAAKEASIVFYGYVPGGRGERRIVHSTSSLLKWIAVIVLVLDMEALRLVHR